MIKVAYGVMMNERIKELIQKMDWEEMGADLWGKTNDGCMTAYALEKFAELIVRECMNVVDPGQNQVIARFQARQWLVEHFGVESSKSGF